MTLKHSTNLILGLEPFVVMGNDTTTQWGGMMSYDLWSVILSLSRTVYIVYVFFDTKPLYHYCAKYK